MEVSKGFTSSRGSESIFMASEDASSSNEGTLSQKMMVQEGLCH